MVWADNWCGVGRCIRPTPEELEDFGTPDFTIYNAGQFPCNRYTHYMTSSTSIDLNLARREMVILGTQYAGEMKKGLFSVMHYLMPKRGILSLHSGCNMGKDGDVALFFGLSGKVSPRHRSKMWPNFGVPIRSIRACPRPLYKSHLLGLNLAFCRCFLPEYG